LARGGKGAPSARTKQTAPMPSHPASAPCFLLAREKHGAAHDKLRIFLARLVHFISVYQVI
jgi:hypothetical protein